MAEDTTALGDPVVAGAAAPSNICQNSWEDSFSVLTIITLAKLAVKFGVLKQCREARTYEAVFGSSGKVTTSAKVKAVGEAIEATAIKIKEKAASTGMTLCPSGGEIPVVPNHRELRRENFEKSKNGRA